MTDTTQELLPQKITKEHAVDTASNGSRTRHAEVVSSRNVDSSHPEGIPLARQEQKKYAELGARVVLKELRFLNDEGKFDRQLAQNLPADINPDALRENAKKLGKQLELLDRTGGDPTLQKEIKESIAIINREYYKAITSEIKSVEQHNHAQPLSEQALDAFVKAFIDPKKNFASLQQEEKLRIGREMYLIGYYLHNMYMEKLVSLPENESSEILNRLQDLQTHATEIIGPDEVKGLAELAKVRQLKENQDVLSFLADPSGKIKRLFSNPHTGVVDRKKYENYLSQVVSTQSNSKQFEKVIQKFSRGLKKGSFDEYLTSGLSAEDEKIVLQTIQEKSKMEIKERLGLSQDGKEYLKTVMGEDANPDNFRQAAEKLIADSRTKDEPIDIQLEKLTQLVSKFNRPHLTATRSLKQFEVSSLLDDAEAQAYCAAREMILLDLVNELFPNAVVLAEHTDPIFDENGIRLTPGHNRLIVLTYDENGDEKGYYLDAAEDGRKVTTEIRDLDVPYYLEQYKATKGNLSPYEVRKGVFVGKAEDITRFGNMINLAALVEDPKIAQEIANNAQALLPESIMTSLILASVTEGEVKEQHIKRIESLNPELKKLKQNNPERFEKFLENRQEFTVERVQDELNYEAQDLVRRRATLVEWEVFLEKVYRQLNYWLERGEYTKEWALGVSQFADMLGNYGSQQYLVDKRHCRDGTTARASEIEKRYDALVRVANVDVAIGRSEFQNASLEFEKFSFDAQYGNYKNVPGVAVAHRVIEREAFKCLVKDKGIYSRHVETMKTSSKAVLEQMGTSWLPAKPDGKPYTKAEISAAIDNAASLAFRLYYTDFTYSVRMILGERLRGDQKHAGQKGQTLAKIMDPLFDGREMLDHVSNLMIDIVGEAVVRASTDGFYDGPGMLTHRRILLQSEVRYNYLPNQALFRQLKDAKSKGKHGSYEKGKEEIEEMLNKTESFLQAQGLNSAKVKAGMGRPFKLRFKEWRLTTGRQVYDETELIPIKRVKEFLHKIGYHPDDYNDNAKIADLLREELEYLDISIKRYDSEKDTERNCFQEEILAKILAYGGANELVDADFADSDIQYRLLVKAGERAGVHLPAHATPLELAEERKKDPRLKKGQEINNTMYDLNTFVYERNARCEIASGQAARAVTDAQELLSKVSYGDLAKVKAAYDELEKAKQDKIKPAEKKVAEGEQIILETRRILNLSRETKVSGEKRVHNKAKVLHSITDRSVADIERDLADIPEVDKNPANPRYEMLMKDLEIATSLSTPPTHSGPFDFEVTTVSGGITYGKANNNIRLAETNLSNAQNDLENEMTNPVNAYMIAQTALSPYLPTDAYKAYVALKNAEGKVKKSADMIEDRYRVAEAGLNAAVNMQANPAGNQETIATDVTTDAIFSKFSSLTINGWTLSLIDAKAIAAEAMSTHSVGELAEYIAKAILPEPEKAQDIAQFALTIARKTIGTVSAIEVANRPGSTLNVTAAMQDIQNFRDVAFAEHNKTDRVKSIIGDLVTGPGGTFTHDQYIAHINSILSASQGNDAPARLARQAVVRRLRYDQIYTLDNWLDYQASITSNIPNASELLTRTDVVGDKSSQQSSERLAPVNMVENMRFLYEEKAKLIAGKNNWEDIKIKMVPEEGLRNYEFTKDKNTQVEVSLITTPGITIRGRTFLRMNIGSTTINDSLTKRYNQKAPHEKISWYEEVLDGSSVMGRHQNFLKRYTLYTDDLREICTDDRTAVGTAANKPGKSRFADAGSAQKDVEEAIMPRLKHPEKDEVWEKGNGNCAGYNEEATEKERNIPFFAAAVEIQAENIIARSAGEMTASILTLIPWFQSKYRRVAGNFATQKGTVHLRNFAEKNAHYVVSHEGLVNIKRKYRIGRFDVPNILGFIMTILESLGFVFPLELAAEVK